MIDLKMVRHNRERVAEGLRVRGESVDVLDDIAGLDRRWRDKLQELEGLQAERNQVSEEIGRRKREGQEAGDLIESMRSVSDRINDLEDEVDELKDKLDRQLLLLPNVPDEDVPPGTDEEDNELLHTWGEVPSFAFEPRPHWEVGTALGILDFERAAKLSGSRFPVYMGAGAQLERALINFMLAVHTGEHGYTEVMPPVLVKEDMMVGTGQLPKFAEDAFQEKAKDLWLIPTAEVPVTNLHREEILNAGELPLKYTAYTPCFRREAGAHGRDTRGLIRVHQFNKVELVRFTEPENSETALEELLADAEAVLQALDLPYRVVTLCGGDLGFAAAKTYDIEVWLPSYDTYREISSVSNFRDFQARRADIRYRRDRDSRPEFVHTLNGSGLAVGRTVAAIMENYQREDGSITVPEALRPYMGGREEITA